MSLLKALGGSPTLPVQQPSAPVPPGSPGLGAGSILEALMPKQQGTQPLALGPMVASNDGIPDAVRQYMQSPGSGHEIPYQGNSLPVVKTNDRASDAYGNVANKATGKSFK